MLKFTATILIFVILLLNGCIHPKPLVVSVPPCSKHEHLSSDYITIIAPVITFESKMFEGQDSEEIESLRRSILEAVADKASKNGYSVHTEADFSVLQRRKFEKSKATLQNSRIFLKPKRRCNEITRHFNGVNTNEPFIIIALHVRQKKARTQSFSGAGFGAFEKISSNLVVAAIDVKKNEVSWIREVFFRSTPSENFFFGALWHDGRFSSELSDALELVLSSFPTSQR